MTERPILFNGPMVRALREGRKTVTRRTAGLAKINAHPDAWEYDGMDGNGIHMFSHAVIRSSEEDTVDIHCPYGVEGDRLWCVDIKPIKFGDGRYGVGDDGNVYNISGPTPKQRRIRLGHNGYEEITLRDGSKNGSGFRVNRLVCEAFYGACPPEFSVCRHLNGLRRDNRPANLDWGTPMQNTADANANGAWSGTSNVHAVLSEIAVREIRQSLLPQKELASLWGVGQPTISKIRSGKRWRKTHPSAPPPNFLRWASRDTMEVISARPERLHAITRTEAVNEGAQVIVSATGCPPGKVSPQLPISPRVDSHPLWSARRSRTEDDWYTGYFALMWEETNGPGSWAKNPWVWRVAFRRIEASA